MRLALISNIVDTVRAFGDIDPAFDRRTCAIRKYMGTIWDLIVPDCSKASDNWYQTLLRHAETMVLAYENHGAVNALARQTRQLTSPGNVYEASDLLLRQLEIREESSLAAAQQAEHDLSRLLHTILDCGGDASKVPPPIVIDGDAPQRKRDSEARRKMFR